MTLLRSPLSTHRADAVTHPAQTRTADERLEHTLMLADMTSTSRQGLVLGGGGGKFGLQGARKPRRTASNPSSPACGGSWGIGTSIPLPSAGRICLYQPTHATASTRRST